MRYWTFPGVGLFWLIALALTASSLQASHLLPIEKALLWEVSRSEKVLGYLCFWLVPAGQAHRQAQCKQLFCLHHPCSMRKRRYGPLRISDRRRERRDAHEGVWTHKPRFRAKRRSARIGGLFKILATRQHAGGVKARSSRAKPQAFGRSGGQSQPTRSRTEGAYRSRRSNRHDNRKWPLGLWDFYGAGRVRG